MDKQYVIAEFDGTDTIVRVIGMFPSEEAAGDYAREQDFRDFTIHELESP